MKQENNNNRIEQFIREAQSISTSTEAKRLWSKIPPDKEYDIVFELLEEDWDTSMLHYESKGWEKGRQKFRLLGSPERRNK